MDCPFSDVKHPGVCRSIHRKCLLRRRSRRARFPGREGDEWLRAGGEDALHAGSAVQLHQGRPTGPRHV